MEHVQALALLQWMGRLVGLDAVTRQLAEHCAASLRRDGVITEEGIVNEGLDAYSMTALVAMQFAGVAGSLSEGIRPAQALIGLAETLYGEQHKLCTLLRDWLRLMEMSQMEAERLSTQALAVLKELGEANGSV
jgi:hypothetical protein